MASLPLLLVVAGCGGDGTTNFLSSIYIQVQPGPKFAPMDSYALSEARVTFINTDSISHSIDWQGQQGLTQLIPAGSRAWFDLPRAVVGTSYSFRLDGSGPVATVTIVAAR
jgi:hypothetical protein